MADPILDPRSADDFYQQTLLLARAYCPDWAGNWPDSLDAAAVDQDPGLVMLNLFSLLAKYLADIENQVPDQRRLAFFQFLNLRLRPPVAAKAALTFSLRNGQPPKVVPAGSAVLDAPTQKIRFETVEPLLVVPATVAAALSIIPAQDQGINALPRLGGTTPTAIFTTAENDPAETPLGHWFLIGDVSLFRPDPALQTLTLTLTGQNLHAAYFDQWFDGALRPLRAVVSGTADGLSLQVTLLDMPQAPACDIADLQATIYAADGGSGITASTGLAASDTTALYWLLVKPAPFLRILTVLERQLPVITALSCVVGGDAIAAQQAAANQAPMNIANGGYPFGQTPAVNDAFYIRSDDVFARTGAQVTIAFDLRPVSKQYPVTVGWEFWDGSAWASFNETPADINLHQFVDTTDNLRGNPFVDPTTIAFICPQIVDTAVAGNRGRWIRAVLLAGGYGDAGGYSTDPVGTTINAISPDILDADKKQQVIDFLTQKAGVTFSFRFQPSNYAPPFIVGLTLSYRLSCLPGRYWSYNSFELSRFLFSPYKPPAEPYAAFHFGFSPTDFTRFTTGHTLAILWHLADHIGVPDHGLSWQYYDGAAWQALPVDDGTGGLVRSGIVRFTVPAGMPAATLFSQSLCWFRILNAHPRREVRLYGLYPNSVGARNAVDVVDEVLGSATGQPSQTFTLNRTPVLPGLALDVIEPQGLQPENGPLTVTPPDTTPGASGRVPRRWNRVDTFAFSGPADRVYTLDNANGVITFGDGRNGMVPPPGHDNIIAALYAYTAGMAGNVGADQLTVLKPGISGITGVFNPMAATGGADGDDREAISARGPALVRANSRAVDNGDLACLAEAASPLVARAQALTVPGPAIRIAVLPKSADARPVARPSLLGQVRADVAAACLAPLAPRVMVSGPDYRPVDVAAQITATVPADQRLAFQQTVAARLTQFLHPVFGGPDGQGWGFGQTVRASSVVTLLLQQDGITAVPGLSLNGQPFADVAIADGQVAAAGVMSVYVYGSGATA